MSYLGLINPVIAPGNGTVTPATISQGGPSWDTSGNVTLTGNITLNNGTADGAQLTLNSAGYSAWNWDNYSGRLRAYYGATEYFTIDTSGNVGIGTSSPGTKLDVSGVARATTLSINGTTAFSTGTISSDSNWGMYLRAAYATTGSAAEFAFVNYAGTERARIDSSGNLLVGTTGNNYGAIAAFSNATNNATIQAVGYFRSTQAGDVGMPGLYVMKYDNNSTTSQILVKFGMNNGASGQGQINGNGAGAAAFGSFSDARLKENIVDLPSQLNNIMALRPVEFDYIEAEGGGHQTGFIAQEMQAVYEDCVGERGDGMLTVTGWSKTEARLVKAIQEQQAQISDQQAIIESLKTRIETLEAK